VVVPDNGDPLPENFEELIQPYFHPLGYFFITGVPCRSRDGLTNSAFAGYCFFQDAWRTPQQTVLMYLGLSFIFQELRLVNLHGVRYADNKLTARFASRFGFVDCGTVPNYMTDWATGELVAATVSTLARSELESRLRAVLLELRRPPE
jgi:RimJ/RimL family protein N-acetyltransferase